MNRARTIAASMVAAAGMVVASGVLLFTGSGPAAGSTTPATVPIVRQYPISTTVAPVFLPTAILDHWQCDEISCRPVYDYFGH